MNKQTFLCGCSTWIDDDTLCVESCDDSCPVFAGIKRWLALRWPSVPVIDCGFDEHRLGRPLTTEELDDIVKRQTESN